MSGISLNRRRCSLLATLAGVVLLNAACNIVGPILYLTAPRQMQDAETTLTPKRLAIVIEYANRLQENPVFTDTFRERLLEVLKEKEAVGPVVPVQDFLKLRRENKDFGRWSLQKVGRALGAEQVLYVRIEQLRLRDGTDSPLLTPEVRLRLKLIAPWSEAREARVWPPREEREGRLIYRGRSMREVTDAVALDDEAAKLAKDAAWLAAKPFYRHDLEEPDPWEP
jgi:hypothetical protein